jgi:hypothetical protein
MLVREEGLLPLEEAQRRPVGMIESGPVGGILGSKDLGDSLGMRDIIAASRLPMLVAVLERRVELNLRNMDVFVSAVGGLRVATGKRSSPSTQNPGGSHGQIAHRHSGERPRGTESAFRRAGATGRHGYLVAERDVSQRDRGRAAVLHGEHQRHAVAAVEGRLLHVHHPPILRALLPDHGT